MVFPSSRVKCQQKRINRKRQQVKKNDRIMKSKIKQYLLEDNTKKFQKLGNHFLHGCKNRRPHYNLIWNEHPNIGGNPITNIWCGPININIVAYGYPQSKCEDCLILWTQLQKNDHIQSLISDYEFYQREYDENVKSYESFFGEKFIGHDIFEFVKKNFGKHEHEMFLFSHQFLKLYHRYFLLPFNYLQIKNLSLDEGNRLTKSIMEIIKQYFLKK
jgi:hypothetical protein